MNVWSSYQHVYSDCLWCILSIIDPIFYQLKKGGGYFSPLYFYECPRIAQLIVEELFVYHVYLK